VIKPGGNVERELWLALYRMLRAAARQVPRRKRVRVGDAVIVAVYFWAALHDRPVCWATHPRNWPRELLDFALPSQSTMSRRLRTSGVRNLMAALHEPLGGHGDALIKTIDAKPLPVGAHSVAKDARWGRGVRGPARGYKLHALYGGGGGGSLPIAWEVAPMNASEQRVARRLLRHLAGGAAAGYVLADGVYDVNDLYARAAAVNHQLLAPRKRPEAGLGHRDHHPNRLRAIEMLEGPRPAFGRTLYALRTTIERRFGRLTNFGGGLAPLPNWVRTLPRVRLWVHAKLLIDALRWQLRARLAA
jgi:hypothetical protein